MSYVFCQNEVKSSVKFEKLGKETFWGVVLYKVNIRKEQRFHLEKMHTRSYTVVGSHKQTFTDVGYR